LTKLAFAFRFLLGAANIEDLSNSLTILHGLELFLIHFIDGLGGRLVFHKVDKSKSKRFLFGNSCVVPRTFFFFVRLRGRERWQRKKEVIRINIM
jgi:hypothetical protein